MSGLLKIKSLVTLALVGTLVVLTVSSVFHNFAVPGELMGLFGTAVGAAIGSLFAKKDAEAPVVIEKDDHTIN